MSTTESQKGIRHVRQKHSLGCGHACLAMLAGVSYDEIVSCLGDPDLTHGTHTDAIDAWLCENGYAISRIYRFKSGRIERKPWPVSPWAEVHIAQVAIPGGSHFVILLHDGTVLDPNKVEPTTLEDPGYEGVNHIAGVFKVFVQPTLPKYELQK